MWYFIAKIFMNHYIPPPPPTTALHHHHPPPPPTTTHLHRPPPPTSTANLRPPSPPTTHLHHHRSLLAIISHVILVLVQLIPRRHYLKILRELESRIRALRTRDTKELWQCVRNIPQFWGHLDKNKNNRIQNRHRPYPHRFQLLYRWGYIQNILWQNGVETVSAL